MSQETLILSKEARADEVNAQEQLANAINNKTKIVFDAGAGAGKTYSLIECLRHILIHYSEELSRNNQKALCITYTNVAANEVKRRIGNSDLLHVSTIHDFLWNVIRKHQPQLVTIHKEKVLDELTSLKNDLSGEKSEYKAYKELSSDLQEQFNQTIQEDREMFYSTYSMKAKEVREQYKDSCEKYPELFKNITNFRKIGSTIYKIAEYKMCLDCIERNEEKYRQVKYDSKRNRDSLHYMRISHETVLDYSFQLISSYDVLKQIIIDCYPYILIDEYQDTALNLVKILQTIDQHSSLIKHPIFIGYFGDKAQNIYETGIGSNLEDEHLGLSKINKKANRRSSSKVIKVINKIRADEIEQDSIYENFTEGSVKFYTSCAENRKHSVNRFIEKYKHEWGINEKKELHCLVLTNKLLAELTDFPNAYAAIAESGYYKQGRNFELIKTDFLSDQEDKLGAIPLLLFKILKFKTIISNKDSIISEFVNKTTAAGLSFSELKKIVLQLQDICGNSLCELMVSMLEACSEAPEDIAPHITSIITPFIDIKTTKFEAVYNYMLEKLNPNLNLDDDEDLRNAQKHLDSLLEIDIAEWDLWYNLISSSTNQTISFHTYHGTKGEEYGNVLIFMENSFGRKGDFFSKFFKQLSQEQPIEENERIQHEMTRNLLYVSCSRAIKNLRILYLDDIGPFRDGIESIFSEASEFSID